MNGEYLFEMARSGHGERFEVRDFFTKEMIIIYKLSCIPAIEELYDNPVLTIFQ